MAEPGTVLAYVVAIMRSMSGAGVRLTYEDFLLLPDDGKRHELIDGEHYVTPSPSTRHQRISGNLHWLIRSLSRGAPGWRSALRAVRHRLLEFRRRRARPPISVVRAGKDGHYRKARARRAGARHRDCVEGNAQAGRDHQASAVRAFGRRGILGRRSGDRLGARVSARRRGLRPRRGALSSNRTTSWRLRCFRDCGCRSRRSSRPDANPLLQRQFHWPESRAETGSSTKPKPSGVVALAEKSGSCLVLRR